MGDSRRLRLVGWGLFLAGLGLFTLLVAWQGAGEILASLESAGLWIVPVAFLHFVPVLFDAAGWRVLVSRENRPSFLSTVYVRWIGESVNTLLPVAQVGGDMVKVRLIMKRGVPGAEAGASIVVDVTLGLLTMIVFAAFAAVVLALGDVEGLDWLAAVVGLAISAGCLYGFYWAQHKGMFQVLARFIGKFTTDDTFTKLVGGAEAVDAAIGRVYERRRDIFVSAGWRLVAWVSGTIEVWFAMKLFGAPISWSAAYALEGLVQIARIPGFAIPGMLGVQEGGYLIVGSALGISGELSLAVALVRRARELIVGLPGLLAWQVEEGRRLLRRGSSAVPEGDSSTRGPRATA